MQQPPIITYNLKERGRKYRGVERNFDIPSLVASINGPATQERVKTRGMLGYFGHWPRLRFGMEPAEGGIADGKAQSIEPAVVTVYLKAHPDGTVEHQTEFLDTETGQLAARMYANRVGGFSSAIDMDAPELYGFDWVNDPNYSTNRGYELALDSAADGGMSITDVILAEQQEKIEAQRLLIDTMERSMGLALDAASRLEQDNNELLDLLARQNAATAKVTDNRLAFDDVVTGGANPEAVRMKRESKQFMDSALPTFLIPEEVDNDEAEAEYLSLSRRVVPHV
jgi:hypothetical protein